MTRSRAVRHGALALAAVAVAAAGSVVQAPGAAAVELLQCEGVNVTSFAPGLRLADQQVTLAYRESLGPCPLSGTPAIGSGAASASFPVTAGCLHLDLGATGSKTFEWSTGESSRFEFAIVGTTAGGQAIVTNAGTITAGRFAGAAATEVITNPSISLLDCLAPPGVETLNGTIRLVIAG